MLQQRVHDLASEVAELKQQHEKAYYKVFLHMEKAEKENSRLASNVAKLAHDTDNINRIEIQKTARGWLARRRVLQIRTASSVIQQAFR